MADLIVTAASVLPGTAAVSSGILGETCTAGQAVYLKASDSRLWLAQADGTAAEADVVGVLLNGGAAGQPAQYATSGPMTIGATTVKTTTYVLSAAAGGICPQADLVSTNRIVRVGYATDTAGAFTLDRRVTGAVV